ncbi:MAG: penicillin-binding protein [Bacteroidota bacterium]
MRRVSSNILKRVYLLMGAFALFGLIIVFKVMGLQFNQSKWMQKAQEEKVFFKKVFADRGNIMTEKGEIMATSLPFFRIAMDATIVDTADIEHFPDSLWALATLLTDHFGVDYLDTVQVNDTVFETFWRRDTAKHVLKIRKAMREQDRHIYLTRQVVDFNKVKEIKTWPILNRGRYKGGLVLEKIQNRRYYPYGDLARITLGIMAHDTVGIRGIEAAYNEDLRGIDGYTLAQKVAGGSYLPMDRYGQEDTRDGKDVVVTLDVDLQDIVERALERGVKRFAAKSGTAVLIEVETGKIKALANYPETYNHTVASGIEPGSTFKLVSAVAALEDKLIELTDTIDTGEGKAQYDDWEISDDAAYGKIPFKKVFARSSNVGMAKLISEGYGEMPERYLEHLRRFGFMEPANNQLVGEPEPVIHEPGDEMWNITTLPSMAYGYSIKVTPLQMAAFYNALANNGTYVRPWLVKAVQNNAKMVKEYEAEISPVPVCSDSTIEKVKELMVEVVNNGTARYAFRNMPFQVAGKTGTVRKNIGGRYVRKYRASFGGFFPADEPRYTCYIVVDEPVGKRIGGGNVSAPIFREIAEKVQPMDVMLASVKAKKNSKPVSHPVRTKVQSKTAEKVFAELGLARTAVPDSTSWVIPKSNGHQINLQAYDQGQSRVPNLRGMSARDALFMMENMGVNVKIIGQGRVRRQSLQPGFIIGKETAITLYLG